MRLSPIERLETKDFSQLVLDCVAPNIGASSESEIPVDIMLTLVKIFVGAFLSLILLALAFETLLRRRRDALTSGGASDLRTAYQSSPKLRPTVGLRRSQTTTPAA